MGILNFLFENPYRSKEKLDQLESLIARSFYEGCIHSSNVGGYFSKNGGTTGALEAATKFAKKTMQEALSE